MLDRPVIKSDFKACLSYTDQFANEIKLNLLTVVMGVPKLIFSRTCHTRKWIFNGLVVVMLSLFRILTGHHV